VLSRHAIDTGSVPAFAADKITPATIGFALRPGNGRWTVTLEWSDRGRAKYFGDAAVQVRTFAAADYVRALRPDLRGTVAPSRQ